MYFNSYLVTTTNQLDINKTVQKIIGNNRVYKNIKHTNKPDRRVDLYFLKYVNVQLNYIIYHIYVIKR